MACIQPVRAALGWDRDCYESIMWCSCVPCLFPAAAWYFELVSQAPFSQTGRARKGRHCYVIKAAKILLTGWHFPRCSVSLQQLIGVEWTPDKQVISTNHFRQGKKHVSQNEDPFSEAAGLLIFLWLSNKESVCVWLTVELHSSTDFISTIHLYVLTA